MKNGEMEEDNGGEKGKAERNAKVRGRMRGRVKEEERGRDDKSEEKK